MSFKVTGNGHRGIALAYEKNTLREAGYLASKMKDNGVLNVRIWDGDGNKVPLKDAKFY